MNLLPNYEKVGLSNLSSWAFCVFFAEGFFIDRTENGDSRGSESLKKKSSGVFWWLPTGLGENLSQLLEVTLWQMSNLVNYPSNLAFL